MNPNIYTPSYLAYTTRDPSLYAGQGFDVQLADGSIGYVRSSGTAWQFFSPTVGGTSEYVYTGTWAGRPATSTLANGDRLKFTDLSVDGGVCVFHVRTVGGTKYLYPEGDVVLASAISDVSGTDGSGSTLATPLFGPLTGAVSHTFLTLTNLIPAGLLLPPKLQLVVQGVGKKTGTGGSAAYVAAIGASIAAGTLFGGAVTGSGNNQDAIMESRLITQAGGKSLGLGTASPNGSAAQQMAPLTLSNGAAQSVAIGVTAANAADSHNLYSYRVLVRA